VPIAEPWLDWCESEDGQGYRCQGYRWSQWLTMPVTFATYNSTGSGTLYDWRSTNTTSTGEWTTLTWNRRPLRWVDMGERETEAEIQVVPDVVALDFPNLERRSAERQAHAMARAEAKIVAEALLISFLSEEQLASWRDHNRFEVVGSHGGRYRLNEGISGNVEWHGPNGWQTKICAHPDMCGTLLPTADVVLSQMLALQTDEAAFVRVANVHVGQPPVVGALVAA